jgi:hypothetical protein
MTILIGGLVIGYQGGSRLKGHIASAIAMKMGGGLQKKNHLVSVVTLAGFYCIWIENIQVTNLRKAVSLV